MHSWCMSKVNIRGDECWIWNGYIDPQGYGRFNAYLDGDVLAHRISYRLHIGEIPEDLEIDHLCGVRSCINPSHLEAVTHLENVRRGRSGEVNGRRQRSKTQCPQGHPYSGDNLYVCPRAKRGCRACRTEASQRRNAKLKVSQT